MIKKKAIVLSVGILIVCGILIVGLFGNSMPSDLLTNTSWCLETISNEQGSSIIHGTNYIGDIGEADKIKDITLEFDKNGHFTFINFTDNVKYKGSYYAEDVSESIKLDLLFDDAQDNPIIAVCGIRTELGQEDIQSITFGIDGYIFSFIPVK